MNRLEWYSAWQQARKIKDYDLLANEILHGTDQNLEIGLMLLSERDVQTIEISPKVLEKVVEAGFRSLQEMIRYSLLCTGNCFECCNQFECSWAFYDW